jgi:hypothetical protein
LYLFYRTVRFYPPSRKPPLPTLPK